jgi:acyl carrier protein
MDLKKELLDLIFELSAVPADDILNAKNWKAAGIDSLDTIEILMEISDRYNIKIKEEDEENITDFNLLLEYVSTALSAQNGP